MPSEGRLRHWPLLVVLTFLQTSFLEGGEVVSHSWGQTGFSQASKARTECPCLHPLLHPLLPASEASDARRAAILSTKHKAAAGASAAASRAWSALWAARGAARAGAFARLGKKILAGFVQAALVRRGPKAGAARQCFFRSPGFRQHLKEKRH